MSAGKPRAPPIMVPKNRNRFSAEVSTRVWILREWKVESGLATMSMVAVLFSINAKINDMGAVSKRCPLTAQSL